MVTAMMRDAVRDALRDWDVRKIGWHGYGRDAGVRASPYRPRLRSRDGSNLDCDCVGCSLSLMGGAHQRVRAKRGPMTGSMRVSNHALRLKPILRDGASRLSG